MTIKPLLWLCCGASFSTLSAVPIASYEQLMEYSCNVHEMTASAALQTAAAQLRVESADFNKWIPEITASVNVYAAKGQPTSFFAVQGGSVQDPEQPNFYQKGEAWQGQMDISWDLYEEGKWIGQSSLANSEAESALSTAEAQLTTAQREALLLVSQYYFDAIMFSAQVEVLQPLVEKRYQQLDDMKTKLAEGVSTTDDYYTANAAYASLKDQWVDAERQVKVNLGYLRLLLQQEVQLLNALPQKSLKELAAITTKSVSLTNLDALVEMHPDIALLRSKLSLEKEKLDSQYGKLKPNLSLYVNLRTGDNFEDALRRDYGEVGLTFSYPLGSVVSNYQESKAIRKSVLAIDTELDYLRKIKALQAANIAGDMESSKSKIEVARLELARREQMLLSESQRVESGIARLDDLVQAEDDKINAQLNLLTSYNQAWLQFAEASLFSNQMCSPE